MELKIDKTKTYAIALEGGGAKGAYEVGVWWALEEAGIKYNAVSGTSVGALNGGLMAARDLKRAVDGWKDIKMEDVIRMDPEEAVEFKKVVKGEYSLAELPGLRELGDILKSGFEIVQDKGLDVEPLRNWVASIIDAEKIAASDVSLFVCTLNLTDKKAMEIRVNDLPPEEIINMLLASAYHPTFKQEKLGGKLYADGGFFDSIPLHVLVENGYKNIIAVRMPGGGGFERPFIKPADVDLISVTPSRDLGSVLNFDAEQARFDMLVGYYDGKKVLYGLEGSKYFLERTLSEREALGIILDRMTGEKEAATLRPFLERELPLKMLKYGLKKESYYDLLIAMLEEAAEKAGLDPLHIYKDRDLLPLWKAQA